MKTSNDLNEYQEINCIYCKNKTIRRKNKKDWKKGEVQKTGHYNKTATYLYCDNCKKTMLQRKWKKQQE